MALLGVPDQLGETARTAQELASATGAAPGPLARLAELRSLMAAEGYGFARDVPLGDSPAWQPWHVVEFLRQ